MLVTVLISRKWGNRTASWQRSKNDPDTSNTKEVYKKDCNCTQSSSSFLYRTYSEKYKWKFP